MAKFILIFSQNAQSQIAQLDVITRKRLGKKLLYFIESGIPLSFATQIVNTNPALYRFRVGKYRIFFEINGNKLNILSVKRRDEAYRGMK